MELGAPELILILVIVILLFGVGRIGKVAGELGSGIRAFREGLRDEGPQSKIEEKEEVPVTGDEKIRSEEKS